MDRKRYIQWEVASADLENSPLGYRVSMFENRFGGKQILSDNSFEPFGDFEYYNGSAWTNTIDGIAETAATPVRYRIQPGKLQQLILAQQGKISRVMPYGLGVVEEQSAPHLNPIYLAVDALTNEIWITDANQHLYRLTVLNAETTMLPLPANTLAVIPNLVRGQYWVVTPTETQQRNQDHEILNTISHGGFGPLSTIESAEVSRRSGDLFILSNNVFLHLYTDGSLDGFNGAVFQDFVSGGFGSEPNAVLLVDGTNKIHRYDGNGTMTLDAYTLGGTTNGMRIAGLDQESTYVWGSDGGLRKYNHPGFTLSWEIYVAGVPEGVTPRIISHSDMSEVGRLITWWGADNEAIQTGTLRDGGAECYWCGSQTIRLNGSSFCGDVLRPFATKHAWVKIEAVSALDAQSPPSSSSESSTTS